MVAPTSGPAAWNPASRLHARESPMIVRFFPRGAGTSGTPRSVMVLPASATSVGPHVGQGVPPLSAAKLGGDVAPAVGTSTIASVTTGAGPAHPITGMRGGGGGPPGGAAARTPEAG